MHAHGLDKHKIALYTGIGLSTVEHLLAKINRGFVVPTHEPIRPKQQRARVLTEDDVIVCWPSILSETFLTIQ